jgi:hypothetical protein
MDLLKISFDQWLEIGLRAGHCSPPVCSTHDGIPQTITEDAEFMDGSDPCVFVIRPYADKEEKEAVEANSMPAQWRNPYYGELN